MRMLMEFKIPVEAGNKAIKDGSLMKISETLVKDLKAEAAYFFANDGHRGGFIVFDLAEPSQIPGIAEPLFLGLHATVNFTPVMTPADLAAAGPGIAKAIAARG